jgi:hypothetical protein
MNVDKAAVSRWTDPYKPPVELAIRTGVSYDWLLGLSSFMWSERVVNLRRSLRSYLTTTDAKSPSQRVIAVIEFLRSQAPDLVTDEYLAKVMRVDVETIRLFVSGDDAVGRDVIRKLAEFVDIDASWFDTGDKALLVDWSELGEQLRSAGFTPVEVEAMIRRKVADTM